LSNRPFCLILTTGATASLGNGEMRPEETAEEMAEEMD
jgi:hypothetical protein